jgi:hypothetical protein
MPGRTVRADRDACRRSEAFREPGRTARGTTFGVRSDPGLSRLPTGGRGSSFCRFHRGRGRVGPAGRRSGGFRRPSWIGIRSPGEPEEHRTRDAPRRHRTGARSRANARFRAWIRNREKPAVRSTSVESCRFRTPPRLIHTDPVCGIESPAPRWRSVARNPPLGTVVRPPAGIAIGGDPRLQEPTPFRRGIGIRTGACG